MKKGNISTLSRRFTEVWFNKKKGTVKVIGLYDAHECLRKFRWMKICWNVIHLCISYIILLIGGILIGYSDPVSASLYMVVAIAIAILLYVYIYHAKAEIGKTGINLAKKWKKCLKTLNRLKVGSDVEHHNTQEIFTGRLHQLAWEILAWEEKEEVDKRDKAKICLNQVIQLGQSDFDLVLGPIGKYFPKSSE